MQFKKSPKDALCHKMVAIFPDSVVQSNMDAEIGVHLVRSTALTS
jgi:hypothetical protein